MVVQFSMSSYTVSEAAAMVEVAVQISTANEIVIVSVSTVDGTAIGKCFCFNDPYQLAN